MLKANNFLFKKQIHKRTGVFNIEGIRDVFDAILLFISYSFIAVFVQNAVLGRALGISRLVKIAQDDESGKVFCALLCVVQLLCALLYYFAIELLGDGFLYFDYIRPLIVIVCTSIVFLFMLIALAAILKPDVSSNVLGFLPAACFNTCIMGTLLISSVQGFNFAQILGFALGSGIGYSGVLFLMKLSEERIQNSAVPAALKGLPINLIFLAILSLVIYGINGNMLSF